jgi:hypothetical protein
MIQGVNSVLIITLFTVELPACKYITFCISRDIFNAAADTSNGELAVGSNTKRKTSICTQSLESPEKKKRNSDDQQDTSLSEEDISVAANTKGPSSELGEGLRPQSSRLNNKYEISLADEKYVCFCAVYLMQSMLFVSLSCVLF